MERSHLVEMFSEVWMVTDAELPGLVQPPGNKKYRYGIGVIQRDHGVFKAAWYRSKDEGGDLGEFRSLRGAVLAIETRHKGYVVDDTVMETA